MRWGKLRGVERGDRRRASDFRKRAPVFCLSERGTVKPAPTGPWAPERANAMWRVIGGIWVKFKAGRLLRSWHLGCRAHPPSLSSISGLPAPGRKGGKVGGCFCSGAGTLVCAPSHYNGTPTAADWAALARSFSPISERRSVRTTRVLWLFRKGGVSVRDLCGLCKAPPPTPSALSLLTLLRRGKMSSGRGTETFSADAVEFPLTSSPNYHLEPSI